MLTCHGTTGHGKKADGFFGTGATAIKQHLLEIDGELTKDSLALFRH